MSDTTSAQWPAVLRPFAARPRLIAAAVAGVAAFFALAPLVSRIVTRSLLSWDAGVLVFIVASLWSMATADHGRMKQHALTHDEGKHFILIIAIGAAIASVAALGAELAGAKGVPADKEALKVALSAGTIALSWAFVQVIFALHYAHDYYALEDAEDGPTHKEGLDFPGDEPPDYWDFLHFAVIIGATAQTADVTIVSKALRRVSTVHSLIAFAFNTAILALMINLAAGLF